MPTHSEIEFEHPIGYAPALLTLWGFDPVYQAAVNQYGPKWTEPQNIVTNGPFTIASWVHNKEIVLVPNPYYEGKKPSVSKVVLTLIQQPFQTDDGVALRAFENNEVDYADVPFSEIDRLKQDETLSKEFHFASKLRPVWINFDTTNKPWSDPRVRQAFSLAIDRDLLSQTIFKGEYKPLSSLIPPSLLPENASGNGIKFDAKKAKKLLAEAGYPNGQGFPAFTLRAASNPTNQLLAPALQEQWHQNLGITNMKIELLERKTYDQLTQKSYKTQPFDLTIGGLTADFLDPAAYFDTWLSTRQEFWNNHWVNAQYDQLVDEAHQVADQSKRSALYTNANSILTQDLPATPLWLDGWAYVQNPRVTQFSFAFSNVEPKFETVVTSGK